MLNTSIILNLGLFVCFHCDMCLFFENHLKINREQRTKFNENSIFIFLENLQLA